jgi:hypothetical protein
MPDGLRVPGPENAEQADKSSWLVIGWIFFDAIRDQQPHGCFSGHQTQSELFLDSSKNGRSSCIDFRRRGTIGHPFQMDAVWPQSI